MVNSREDFHLQDLAHAGRTNRPLAVATLSIPALKGEVFREFSIKNLSPLFHSSSCWSLQLCFSMPGSMQTDGDPALASSYRQSYDVTAASFSTNLIQISPPSTPISSARALLHFIYTSQECYKVSICDILPLVLFYNHLYYSLNCNTQYDRIF